MTNNNIQELLPCPFCGGKAEITSRHLKKKPLGKSGEETEFYVVGCLLDIELNGSSKGCGISRSAWIKEEAIVKWNTRSTQHTPKNKVRRTNKVKELVEKIETQMKAYNHCHFVHHVLRDCKTELERLEAENISLKETISMGKIVPMPKNTFGGSKEMNENTKAFMKMVRASELLKQPPEGV